MMIRIRLVLLTALVGCTPGLASAGPIQLGDALHFWSSDGMLGGGAFHVDNTSNGVGEDLVTFCLQRSQYIDYSSLFTVGGITGFADDAAGNDYISNETRWIFSMFVAGELGAYSADAIQAAIWKLEDEWTSDFGNSADLIAIAQMEVIGGFVGGHVSVLNLFRADGTKAQDQLVMSPVPEPGSMLLFGTGLAALIRRRLRRA